MSKILDLLKQLIRWGIPGRYNSLSFIIDSANPLLVSTGVSYSLEIMEDIAGLVIVDKSLSGGGSYPDAITAGYITFGNFTEVSISSGKIKAYLV